MAKRKIVDIGKYTKAAIIPKDFLELAEIEKEIEVTVRGKSIIIKKVKKDERKAIK